MKIRRGNRQIIVMFDKAVEFMGHVEIALGNYGIVVKMLDVHCDEIDEIEERLVITLGTPLVSDDSFIDSPRVRAHHVLFLVELPRPLPRSRLENAIDFQVVTKQALNFNPTEFLAYYFETSSLFVVQYFPNGHPKTSSHPTA